MLCRDWGHGHWSDGPTAHGHTQGCCLNQLAGEASMMAGQKQNTTRGKFLWLRSVWRSCTSSLALTLGSILALLQEDFCPSKTFSKLFEIVAVSENSYVANVTVKVTLGNPELRIITLAPTKLVEMLIKNRIIKDLAENNMMETDHHGFCKRNLCLCKIFTFFVHINYWVW